MIQNMNRKIIKQTPFGPVAIIWSVSGKLPKIVSVLLSRPVLPAEKQAAGLFPESRILSCAEIDRVASSIKAYLEGEDITFNLNLVDLSPFSKFQQSVLRAQHAIPRGRVSTYGLIAAHVGAPGGARAVGNVMAGNPFPLIVPCHRTILSNGRLGGFQSGSEIKRALLKNEGVMFDEAGRAVCPRFHF